VASVSKTCFFSFFLTSGRYSTLIIKYNVAFWTKPWVAEWLRFLTSVLKVNRLTWGRVALPTLAVDNLQTGVSHFALSAIVSIPHTCDNRDLDNKLLKFTPVACH
jgi:hypothetical protein